jgi:iron(III) transport system substrate-binding protein
MTFVPQRHPENQMRYLRALVVAACTFATTAASAEEVVVYSARIEQLIRPLFEAYTSETGISVKYVTDREGPLLEKLKAEGASTPADLLLTVDAGNLWQAAQLGLLQPSQSKVLESNVPGHLRDPGGHWYGLTVRARTIVYNKEKVRPSELSTYEALGDAKWKDRLCLRTSKSVYNQSLTAMMIAEFGEARTEGIVSSWVANLGVPVFPSDNKVIEAIAAGQCDVGITNSYYLGRMLAKTPDLPVSLFWPDQMKSGVHVNISGAGVTRHAKNARGGLKLLEWLSTPAAQKIYADANMEYPVNPAVTPDSIVANWGSFKQNPFNVSKAGELQAAAVRLMDRAGYP